MEDEIDRSTPMRLRRSIPHYHGDAVRSLMVSAAVVMLVAETFWRALPLAVPVTIALVIVFAVAAGLTNPNAVWIHYLNVLLAAGSTFLFGNAALTEGFALHDPGALTNEILALIGILTLYFATKTLRGVRLFHVRTHPPAE
ncbi:MAG: hypothetical protein B7X04_01925 [Parcubacteria group bacterium 21-54-25]|nr:MAG: hypothetical protein B7X04_01925 [Parcubacteria group bacterium 21-54-25]HQU07669.1 hypothetical protein [Candidatus Paceibacterota bacterium]